MTREQIAAIFSDAGLAYAIPPDNHDTAHAYAEEAFRNADHTVAPTSETSLWGHVYRQITDLDAVRWWANVYRAAINAFEAGDQDTYNQVLADVYEGNGDKYQ